MPLVAPPADHLVGRERELAAIRGVVAAAVAGEASTLLITGDAGIGKTSLAREAVLSMIQPPALVSGSCLPLQTINVPLHPLRLALRASAAAGTDRLIEQLETPERAPGAIDAWVDRMSAERPVVIVLDDLQWADQSTLDVLVYLAAGPRDRRLALLATLRRESLPNDHPLHRWLADVLRLPRVGQLGLTGLERTGTEAQLAALLGAAPHQSLVDDVFHTTQGNPYWNRLLVHDLTPDVRRLPGDLPTDLVTALRRSWSALSEPARDLSSLVAVGGRPISADALQQVAGALGLPEILPALREAVRARVFVVTDEDRYWFEHPLIAQVLEHDVTVAERQRWHAAYAELDEKALHAGRPLTLDQAIALADHHHAAGHQAQAYRWALRSWEVAGNARGSPELFRLLQRTVRLRADGLADDAVSIHQLRHWLWQAAQDRGADSDELTAIDDLLEELDAEQEPLAVSSLLVRRMLLRYTLGAGFAETDDVRRAVDLAASEPASWEYAQALAETAHTGLWAGDPDAPGQAELALRVARAAGHPRALCLALAANAMKETFAGHREAALRDARESLEHGIVAREWLGYVMATLWERYALTRSTDQDPAEWVGRRRLGLVEHGAPQTYVARLSAAEAEAAGWSGDWRRCQDRLRGTFGCDPGAFADVTARLAAARLAAWQGRLDEAEAHLERADELLDEPRRYLNFPYVTVRTEVLLARRQAAEAYEAARSGLSGHPPWPVLSDWLVPLAARALAESAEDARGNGQSDAAILAELDRFEQRYPSVLAVSWDPAPAASVPALMSWYRAEAARARRDPAAADLWQATIEAASSARSPWLQAYAGWRTAEALLGAGQVQRAEARSILRSTYALAVQLQATPILDELGELARVARLELALPEEKRASVVLPGLTPREREILAHVVRGATYAEIAESLVISEKTVSSHVSNLLRKTGTASRVELSRLASRADRTLPRPSR